jgi:hypothetical protein
MPVIIDVDAGKLGLAIAQLESSAEKKGERAVELVNKGDALRAGFYAEWAASIANAAIAIEEGQNRAWGKL